MKIRDAFATLNNDPTVHEFPSGGIEILSDTGGALLSITQQKDGAIRIHAGSTCNHQGVILDDVLIIRPRASNAVEIVRPEYSKRSRK